MYYNRDHVNEWPQKQLKTKLPCVVMQNTTRKNHNF